MIVTVLVFTLLGLAAAGFLYRALAGPSVTDRVIAVDGLLLVAISLLAADAVRRDSGEFVDTIVVIGLLGFVGTGVAGRFIERRGG